MKTVVLIASIIFVAPFCLLVIGALGNPEGFDSSVLDKLCSNS